MAFFSSCVYLLAAKIHVLVNYRPILVLIICLSWMFLEVARSDLAWENIFDVNFHLQPFFGVYIRGKHSSPRNLFLTVLLLFGCSISFPTLFSTLTGS